MPDTPYRSARLFIAIMALAACSLWAGFVGNEHLGGRDVVLERLDAPLLDLRFVLSGPKAPPDDVVIVAIDDETIRDAGSFPLPRQNMARLVEAIRAGGASVVAVDALFLEAGAEQADKALAEALAAGPTVIAAAALFSRDGEPEEIATQGDGLPRAKDVLGPRAVFAQSSSVGAVNLDLDAGGTPRYAPLLLIAPDGGLLPSLALRAVALGRGVEARVSGEAITLGHSPVRLDLGLALPLRYYGPRGAVQTVSAAAVLRGDAPKGRFVNQLVLVGTTAVGAGDTFATPFDPVMPGVEVLATAVGNLSGASGLVRDRATRRLDVTAAAGLALAGILALMLAPLPIGIPLLVAAHAAWLAGAVLAFDAGYWLSASLPLVVSLPPALVCVVLRQGMERRAARALDRSQSALGRLQPRHLVERLRADPDWLSRPMQMNATVLFIDITGFTGLSEALGPQQSRGVLDRFHALVEEEVAGRGGMVMGFLGDGAMAVFGLTAFQNAGAAALETAVALDRRVGSLPRPDDPADPLSVRIGVNAGPVVLSRFGTDDRQHISVTGDAVNTASRLVEAAKVLGARIVVGSDVFETARDSPVSGLGWSGPTSLAVRGKMQPVSVRSLGSDHSPRVPGAEPDWPHGSSA